MSIQRITELRKAGRLSDAYALAGQLLDQDFSIWHRRAMAWVLYEQLKQPDAWLQPEQAVRPLSTIINLQLPEEEKMYWEILPFGIGKLVAGLPADASAGGRLERIFDLIRGLPIRRPGAGGSYLVRSFLRAGKTWPRFPVFLDWWGLDSFVPDDYIPPVLADDRRGMALVEQVLIGLARHLLLEDGGHPPGAKPDPDLILARLPVYDQIARDQPLFRYVPYYRSRLLAAAGRPGPARTALLPFARQKSGEFWVWDLLGDLYEDRPDLQFACLCRALACKTDPKFNVKIRRKAVPKLLARGEAGEAAVQVRTIAGTYGREGWNMPGEVSAWLQSAWFAEHKESRPDQDFYQRHARPAEMLLFEDLPETVVLVTGLNQEKHVLYFIDSNDRQGFAHFRRLKGQLELGSAYRLRLEGVPERLAVRAFAKLSEQEIPETLCKSFRGVFRQTGTQAFGFVGDVFLPPALVATYSLSDGKSVKGKALRTWDRKKSAPGWRATSVLPE